jgi:hypothetical protein
LIDARAAAAAAGACKVPIGFSSSDAMTDFIWKKSKRRYAQNGGKERD